MDTAIQIFQFLHSWLRWLVVLVAVGAAVYFVLRLVQRAEWDSLSSRLMTAFSSLIGLQWMIGLVLLILWLSLAGSQRHYWEHLTMMTVALVVAHGHFMWRRRQLSSSNRYTRNLLVIIAVVVLVFIGISVLPEGIEWRFYPSA